MLPLDKLLDLAGSAGLRTSQVAEFRQRFGVNEMTPPVRESLWKQYLKHFDDPIIRILLLAVTISTIVSLIRGSGFLDILGIIVAILLSTGIAFFNEYRSSREFDILNATRDDMAVKVIRDGHPASVPSRDIVVGDLILLEAGDAIPADAWVSASDDIFTDESAFTGESEPVPKELRERVLKGAFVTAGKGQAIAGAVGDSTQMGVIASSLGIDHTTQTPLEQKLEALAGIISKFGYAMAVLISVSLFIRGILTGEVTGLNLDSLNYILHYFMLAVVVVVAAVPEGLPMSVALSLSLAMRKMTRANCLVRRLIACETIGSATTICTDKTGTLTKNQMEVVASSAGNPHHTDNLPADTFRVDHPECCGKRYRTSRRSGKPGHCYRELDRRCTAPLAAASFARLHADPCRNPCDKTVPVRRQHGNECQRLCGSMADPISSSKVHRRSSLRSAQ